MKNKLFTLFFITFVLVLFLTMMQDTEENFGSRSLFSRILSAGAANQSAKEGKMGY
jgi:hypothetical protein